MTEPVEEWICTKFCIKLKHSFVETIWVIQKATAMGPLVHLISHRGFGKTSNHPGDSAPLQPRSGTLRLLAFPKTKITFEREEISDHWWHSGKYTRASDGDWEYCVTSPGAYFEGDWGVIVLSMMFLVFSSINVSIIRITLLDTFWTDLVIHSSKFTKLHT